MFSSCFLVCKTRMPLANSTCFDECSNQCFKQHWCLCATPLTSFSFLLSNYRLGKGHFQTQSGWQITEKCLLKTTSFKRKVPPDTWHSPWACPDTTGWWDWPAQCPARCAPEHQTWPDTVLEHRAAAILKVSWHFTSVHSLSGQHLLLIKDVRHQIHLPLFFFSQSFTVKFH